MRRIRLFSPELSEGSVLLSPEESRHVSASLRAEPGREVVLFDGAGREGRGVIVQSGQGKGRQATRRRIVVNVTGVTQRPFELSLRITLAVAMTKPQRQGYLVEKCTELGVAAIWPVIADRSIGRPTPTTSEKLFRRAIEAAKQAGRAWVPQIAPPRTFSTCLRRIADFNASAITHTDASLNPFGTFLAAQPEAASLLVWVGPEGGWSDAERDAVIEAGALPTTLGPTVLRTETAAVAVCAAAAMCSVTRRPRSTTRPI
jgi:16S rRNA (uracil1498-N3)-methyltransferase